MNSLKKIIYMKNIGAGYLYFYIHLITEIVCFFVLSRLIGDSLFLWLCPLLYDSFAFVPQSILGYLSDKFPNIKIGLIGMFLLVFGLISFCLNLLPGAYTEVVVLCLGNACIHVDGAEITLRCSKGNLSHSAIFVSGGSFGVIIGKLLGKTTISFWFIALLALTMLPFILLANYYRKDADKDSVIPCSSFNYNSLCFNPVSIILLTVIIVIVRGYMGYGIPTTWNKTLIQNVMFYCTMGLGKALGGILSDLFGVKKIALISVLGALPFLLFGDNIMFISLFGILLFSMTMSITLGLLVSVLKQTPGLAFGLTTIGLFLGTLPIFFFRINSIFLNSIIITLLTIVCAVILLKILRKENNYG